MKQNNFYIIKEWHITTRGTIFFSVLLYLCISITQVNWAKNIPGNLTVHQGIPDKGFIDSYHHYRFDGNEILNSLDLALYTMRQTKTADLLRARKAYKEFYYALNDNNSPNSHLDFTAPKEVRKIFINDNGIKINKINNLLLQVEFNRPKADPQLMTKIVRTLTQVSSKLAEIDYYLKFLKKKNMVYLNNDLYNQHKKSKFSKVSISNPRLNRDSFDQQVLYLKIRKSVQSLIDEKISELKQIKSILFDKYPMLSIKTEEGLYFYQAIYDQLVASFSFPARELPILERKIVVEKNSLQLPMNFYYLITRSWKQFGNETSWITTLLKYQKSRFNFIIKTGMKNNTFWLRELNRKVYFRSSDNKDVLWILGLDEKNWEEAQRNFPHITKNKWEKAKRDLITRLKERQVRKEFYSKLNTYASQGLLGLGIISTFSPLALFSPGLFLASGALVVKDNLMNYLESKNQERFYTTLFSATRDSGSFSENQKYIEISVNQLNNLIIGTALSMVLARGLIKDLIPPLHFLPGKNLIKVSKGAYLKALASLSKKIPPVLKNHFSQKIGAQVHPLQGYQNLVNQKLHKMAKKLKVDTKVLIKEFKDSDFYYRHFSKDNRNPFLKQFSTDFIAAMGTILYAEYITRGDRFMDELPFVVLNMMSAASLVAIVTSQNFGANFIKNGSKQKENNVFDKVVPMKEKFKMLFRKGVTTGKLTLPVYGITTTTLASWLHWQAIQKGESSNYQEKLMSAALNTLLAASLMATTSPLRSQGIYKLSETLEKKIGTSATQALMLPAKVGSSFAAATLYTYLAQISGIQSSKEYENENRPNNNYIEYEPNSKEENISYLFPEINI